LAREIERDGDAAVVARFVDRVLAITRRGHRPSRSFIGRRRARATTSAIPCAMRSPTRFVAS
jgi:hypothetical protein